MYFLEQLIAEWYAYQGYFVRTNVKFGKRAAGGYEGEMDIVAFHPNTQELVHVEASMDADSWHERFTKLQRKFSAARKHYSELFPFEHRQIKRVAILGLTESHNVGEPPEGVEIVLIPHFIRQMTDTLRQTNFLKQAVPEELPRPRAIQMATYWALKPERPGDQTR